LNKHLEYYKLEQLDNYFWVKPLPFYMTSEVKKQKRGSIVG